MWVIATEPTESPAMSAKPPKASNPTLRDLSIVIARSVSDEAIQFSVAAVCWIASLRSQ
jgi:hypothetical protein